MCGIVGALTPQNNNYNLPEIINKMAGKIIHRGPDSSGIYFDEDLSFCFAHQRLSIIDLSKNGTSIIVLSQDLDELIEITHKIAVIFDGKLSKPINTNEVDIAKLGLLMGGKNE